MSVEFTAQELAGEAWRPVADFPAYEISSLGRLRRLRGRGRPRTRVLLSAYRHGPNGGYAQHALSDRGRQRRARLRDLVLEAFVGPPPSDQHRATHKDGNPANNRLSNLCWALPARTLWETWQHAAAVLGEARTGARLSTEQVEAIRFLVHCGFPKRKAARVMQCSPRHVRAIVVGRWRALG